MAIATPPARKPGLLGAVVMAALVLVLAWQLAHWTWIFATPPSAAEARATAEGGVDLALAAKLFGGSVSSSPAASASGLRLKGVVAPTPGVAASAIFATGSGKDLSVFIGSEVQPGVSYRLERQIGEGGSGMAYLALRQAADGLSSVVIKFVRTGAS